MLPDLESRSGKQEVVFFRRFAGGFALVETAVSTWRKSSGI
jgi:hypothetical protein